MTCQLCSVCLSNPYDICQKLQIPDTTDRTAWEHHSREVLDIDLVQALGRRCIDAVLRLVGVRLLASAPPARISEVHGITASAVSARTHRAHVNVSRKMLGAALPDGLRPGRGARLPRKASSLKTAPLTKRLPSLPLGEGHAYSLHTGRVKHASHLQLCHVLYAMCREHVLI